MLQCESEKRQVFFRCGDGSLLTHPVHTVGHIQSCTGGGSSSSSSSSPYSLKFSDGRNIHAVGFPRGKVIPPLSLSLRKWVSLLSKVSLKQLYSADFIIATQTFETVCSAHNNNDFVEKSLGPMAIIVCETYRQRRYAGGNLKTLIAVAPDKILAKEESFCLCGSSMEKKSLAPSYFLCCFTCFVV